MVRDPNSSAKSRVGTWRFQKDGRLLYCIQTGETEADSDRKTLFSLDPVSLKQTPIKKFGDDFVGVNSVGEFSLAPDGKSLVFSVAKYRLDLWKLTGCRQPGLWNQIKDAFHFDHP
jgi:hypothetical protein